MNAPQKFMVGDLIVIKSIAKDRQYLMSYYKDCVNKIGYIIKIINKNGFSIEVIFPEHKCKPKIIPSPFIDDKGIIIEII